MNLNHFFQQLLRKTINEQGKIIPMLKKRLQTQIIVL